MVKKASVPLSFLEAIQTVVRKYAEFTGVASRSEFWWWILFTVLVSAVLGVFGMIQLGDHNSLGNLLTNIWSLLVLLPTLAVGVRRLRDAGYRWTNLFWALLPVVGAIILLVFCAQPTKR